MSMNLATRSTPPLFFSPRGRSLITGAAVRLAILEVEEKKALALCETQASFLLNDLVF